MPPWTAKLDASWLRVAYASAGFACVAARRRRAHSNIRSLSFGGRRCGVRRAGVCADTVGATEGVSFWEWRGQRLAYRATGPLDGPVVVMLHGFALSSVHFRRLSPIVADAGFRVYALDLLGFGASAKPLLEYSTALWEEIVQDFCDSFEPRRPVVLLGNSIGSLIAVKAAASFWGKSLQRVRGLVLLNCAGGMNSKGTLSNDAVPLVVRLALWPLFALLDAVLRSPLGEVIFDNLRDRETLTTTLQGLYVNPKAVDEELVDSVLLPAKDNTSFGVFVDVLTGDPGEVPQELLPQVECPVLCVWGDQDNATPLWGDVGQLVQRMDADIDEPHVSLRVISSGHFPHDDTPDAVQASVLPWLANMPARRAPRMETDEDHLDLDDIVM